MADHQCIIIGAGPAGQQAGLFLGRAKIQTLLIGVPERSDLSFGRVIDNYFGVSNGPSGPPLLANGVEHLRRCGVELLSDEVIDIERADKQFVVTTAALQKLSADAVIIATGQQRAKAGIAGENKFLGKGVQTCVACDGPLFRDKAVAVIGNGSHAAEEAIELAAYTKNVSIYSQGNAWEISPSLLQKLDELGIRRLDGRVTAVSGDQFVGQMTLADQSTLPVDGIFLATGSAGGLTFAYKLGLEQTSQGFLVIDRDGRTSLPGVWAAGAVTGGNSQIAKSAGEGCNAAISVIRQLKGIESYIDHT